MALSAIITACVRPMLDAAPLHAFDAPTPGTGKSLLAEAVACIALGHKPAFMNWPDKPEEQDKQLDSALMTGDPVVVIDNVSSALKGDGLCIALTQEEKAIRKYHSQQVIQVPCGALFMATGNNLSIQGDLVRRTVTCRLDAKVERPEERAIRQDLIAECRQRRAELIHAAQTIVAAYIKADMPERQQDLGSFTDWSRYVRSALTWLGEADPVESIVRARQDDPERLRLLGLLTSWHEVVGDKPKAVAEVITEAGNTMPPDAGQELLTHLSAEWPGRMDEDHINRKTLGRYLLSMKDRVEGGYMLQRHDGKDRARWSVVKLP